MVVPRLTAKSCIGGRTYMAELTCGLGFIPIAREITHTASQD